MRRIKISKNLSLFGVLFIIGGTLLLLGGSALYEKGHFKVPTIYQICIASFGGALLSGVVVTTKISLDRSKEYHEVISVFNKEIEECDNAFDLTVLKGKVIAYAKANSSGSYQHNKAINLLTKINTRLKHEFKILVNEIEV